MIRRPVEERAKTVLFRAGTTYNHGIRVEGDYPGGFLLFGSSHGAFDQRSQEDSTGGRGILDILSLRGLVTKRNEGIQSAGIFFGPAVDGRCPTLGRSDGAGSFCAKERRFSNAGGFGIRERPYCAMEED